MEIDSWTHPTCPLMKLLSILLGEQIAPSRTFGRAAEFKQTNSRKVSFPPTATTGLKPLMQNLNFSQTGKTQAKRCQLLSYSLFLVYLFLLNSHWIMSRLHILTQQFNKLTILILSIYYIMFLPYSPLIHKVRPAAVRREAMNVTQKMLQRTE